MTPPAFDGDVVAVRLRLLRDTLTQLEALRGADAARLTEEPVTRAAAERFIQAIVDMAVDINGHIAVAALDRAPASSRESFVLAARAGAIDEALAERLAPAAGLRNVLVHRYVDIDVMRVTEAIETVLDGFAAYVRQVATFVRSRESEGTS